MPWTQEEGKLVNGVISPETGAWEWHRHTQTGVTLWHFTAGTELTPVSTTDRGAVAVQLFFSLWKVTQLTKVFLCLASKRKGDFSHRHLCKLTLTPKSKAGIFLALVSLTATKTQLLKLCWRATKNFGLRRLVPLYILCQESVPGQLQREKGFSKEEFRLCETSWVSPWATWFTGMCPCPWQRQELGLDDP